MKKKTKLFFLSNVLLFSIFVVAETGLCFKAYNKQINESANHLIEYEVLNKAIFDGNIGQGFEYSSQKSIDLITETSSDIYLCIIDAHSHELLNQTNNYFPNFDGLNYIDSTNIVFSVSDKISNINLMITFSLDLTENYYLATAIIKPNVLSVFSDIILFGLIGYILSVGALYLFLNYYFKKTIKPLKLQIMRMNFSEPNQLNEEFLEDIDSMKVRLHNIELFTKEKIRTLINERTKQEYIINSIPQGLIVINKNSEIILANKSAEKILFSTFQSVRGKPLVNFFRKKEVIDLVEQAKSNNISLYKEYQTDEDKYYKINIYSLANENNNDVCLVFNDITQEKILSKSKRDFFANASHELKSPLTTIKGYVQLVKENIITDSKEKDLTFERVISEANRMNDIIIQMLDLSKLEVTKPVITSNISCMDIVNETCSMLEKMRLDKNVSINISGKDFKIRLMKEDAVSLVRNIVENAILYNRHNGEIDINLTNRSLIIKDTGIGIPEKYQKRIFERFYRVDKAKSRKLGGTGLGLSIVKHICINYKLTLDLHSKLNEGTIIAIKFPA
jgi:two-component system phosphate regulon sensor histidine kinase PhoR